MHTHLYVLKYTYINYIAASTHTELRYSPCTRQIHIFASVAVHYSAYQQSWASYYISD